MEVDQPSNQARLAYRTTGDLALPRPGVHGHGAAAVLVEAGSLAHPAGAARLHDPRAQDAIGAAVARGFSGYLGDSGGW